MCCRPIGATRSRWSAARACACTTPTAASTSTCCRASASRRSATRIRGSRARSREQAQTLIHTSNLFYHPLQGELAERLARAVGAAARVLLQQRHGSGRSVPEVRAPLLVHEGRAARRVHRARRIVPRADVRLAVGHVRRALPRAVRAAAADGEVRARRTMPAALAAAVSTIDRGDHRRADASAKAASAR